MRHEEIMSSYVRYDAVINSYLCTFGRIFSVSRSLTSTSASHAVHVLQCDCEFCIISKHLCTAGLGAICSS